MFSFKRLFDYSLLRFESLRNDENGMEAAQVILILALVILGLIPIIRTIVNKVAQQGQSAINCIDAVQVTNC